MTEGTLVDRLWTVGQVAAQFGVTVRTLHHYDQIGLLAPSERSYAGYRQYTTADLERLQSIVVYRRLGFSLEDVAALVDGDGEDLTTHLCRQRDAVTTRLHEVQDLLAAIDKALEKQMSNEPATTADMVELFGEAWEDADTEAEQKWGDSAAWKESKRRTKDYTRADWAAIKGEADALQQAFVDAKRAGLPPTSEVAMDAAEAHRLHIDQWFYALDHAFHRNLGDLYVQDPRFTATYDESLGEPGLAAYVREAIHANADRHS